MKSYLDLISISPKIHRKQTRMTRMCILISVFLISAIFSMGDSLLQSQKKQAIRADGAWHAAFKGISEEQIALIGARPEVKTGSRYAVTNYHLNMGYKINGVQTGLCGFDESFLELFPGIRLVDGNFPKENEEALASESVRDRLGLQAGDSVKIETPDGELLFKISGFIEDTADMLKADAFGIFVNTDAYLSAFQDATLEEDFVYYVEFMPHCRIQNALNDIKTQLDLPAGSVAENAKLLGVLLQSRDNYIMTLYLTAAVLALLVALAGMLMILGSLNSNVAQRTEFFGMMRCLGATGKQVSRFVRIEALSWCRLAIPAGLFASTLISWVLCGMLRAVSPTYFGDMPVFQISLPGIGAGAVFGVLTVLAAARTPAKKASKVSPLTAVSGNAGTLFAAKHAAHTRFLHVETALGIHHASGSRKNMLLLTASFAFSIILFLGFSLGVDFMHHALTPMRPYTPDVSIISPGNECAIPDSLYQSIQESQAVKRIFGRSFAYDLPAVLGDEDKTVMLISYERYQFGWAQRDLRQGSIEQVQEGNGVLLAEKPGFSAEPGDHIQLETKLGMQQVTVSGVLSYAPFDAGGETGTLICSESLFDQLTGDAGYTILDVQLKDQSDLVVEELRGIAAEGGYGFSDQRTSNREVRAVYYSFALFVYSFLAIVALIAAFNIINSIGMSVSARMRQYGAMRAIGTSVRQLRSMVVAEVLSYLICGVISGFVFGLPLHYLLFRQLITSRWGDIWNLPIREFCVIAAVMLVSAIAAVAGPVRRIYRMSIVETIGAQ